jgi:hypothetical protein
VANARATGWSWQQLAARLGVTSQAVHHKDTGRRFGLWSSPGGPASEHARRVLDLSSQEAERLRHR